MRVLRCDHATLESDETPAAVADLETPSPDDHRTRPGRTARQPYRPHGLAADSPSARRGPASRGSPGWPVV